MLLQTKFISVSGICHFLVRNYSYKSLDKRTHHFTFRVTIKLIKSSGGLYVHEVKGRGFRKLFIQTVESTFAFNKCQYRERRKSERKMEKFMKLLKTQTNTLKTEDCVTITGRVSERNECDDRFDPVNQKLVGRRRKHERVEEFKLVIPKSLGKVRKS